MPIGYSKLKSGDWGIRGGGEPPEPGTEVTVVKRDGQERKETVGQVVWTGSDQRSGGMAWLATVQRGTPPPRKEQQPQQQSGDGWQPFPEVKPKSDPGFDDGVPF